MPRHTFDNIESKLQGTPWYVDHKVKRDILNMSIVIRSKKSLDYLSVAYSGGWSAFHTYEGDDWYERGFPNFFYFDSPDDILPWLKKNMDTKSMLAY